MLAFYQMNLTTIDIEEQEVIVQYQERDVTYDYADTISLNEYTNNFSSAPLLPCLPKVSTLK
jgi:hypothetical protein